jgi:hypothetical protein
MELRDLEATPAKSKDDLAVLVEYMEMPALGSGGSQATAVATGITPVTGNYGNYSGSKVTSPANALPGL